MATLSGEFEFLWGNWGIYQGAGQDPRGKAKWTKAPKRKGNGILDWKWIIQNPREFAHLSG